MTATEIIILVAVLLGVVGAGVFFLVRYLRDKKREEEKYDFTTKYGTRVMLSPQTQGITKEVFEMWSDSTIKFWCDLYGWSVEKCHKRLSQTEIEIYDKEYLERAGWKVNGIMWPSSFLIEMASLPKGSDTASVKRIASLFRHEVSHIIAGYVGNIPAGPNGGEDHHKLFAEVKLGA
jgi:hypothetical protein